MEKIEVKDGRKFWRIGVDSEDVFARVSLDSSYREHVLENGGNRYVLLEDDMALFDGMVKKAVGVLWLKLGRMSKGVSGGLKYSEDGAMMMLEVSDNCDDNMLGTLGNFVDQFVDAYVLRLWYERNKLREDVVQCERDAELALEYVVGVVHFRKRAVKRPINPLF